VLVLAATGHIAALHRQVTALPPAWPGWVLIVLAFAAWVAGRRGVAPIPNLALLGAALMALVQIAAMHSIEPMYDVKSMAQAIKQVQDEGRPVANIATYHAQYQFLGRLETPLAEVTGASAAHWLATHPEGYAVVYLDNSRQLTGVSARYKQPYRGGGAVLVNAQTAAALLAAPTE